MKNNLSGGQAPYFGLTGTPLNVWVTIACTAAMTLFGPSSLLRATMDGLL